MWKGYIKITKTCRISVKNFQNKLKHTILITYISSFERYL